MERILRRTNGVPNDAIARIQRGRSIGRIDRRGRIAPTEAGERRPGQGDRRELPIWALRQRLQPIFGIGESADLQKEPPLEKVEARTAAQPAHPFDEGLLCVVTPMQAQK